MPLLNSIVNSINTALIAPKLKTDVLQGSLFNGIAIPVTKLLKDKTVTFPGLRIEGTKDVKALGYDDKYPVVIYHRLISNSYSVQEVDNYGDDYTMIKQVTQMQLVVWGNYTKIGLSEHELEATISGALFGEVHLKPFIQIYVAPTTTNFDKSGLFNQEYKGVDNHLSNEHLYFGINYTIESYFDKNCFSLCDCTTV
jgi:hypothetical protein